MFSSASLVASREFVRCGFGAGALEDCDSGDLAMASGGASILLTGFLAGLGDGLAKSSSSSEGRRSDRLSSAALL
jgi:hypothetical protein